MMIDNITEKRLWGSFITYYSSNFAKIKRLIIDPGKQISMQYHNYRSELWFIEKGTGTISTLVGETEKILKNIGTHSLFEVPVGSWHRITNIGTEPLEIIEIQYGEQCIESDIIRK